MNSKYNLKARKPHFQMKHRNEVYASSIVSYKHAMGFNSGINNVIEVITPNRFQSYAGSTKSGLGYDDESGQVKAHYVLSMEHDGILMIELKVIDKAKYEGRHQNDYLTFEFSQHNTFIPKDHIKKFVYHKGLIFKKFYLITNKNRYDFSVSSEAFGNTPLLDLSKQSFQYKNYKNLATLVNNFNN